MGNKIDSNASAAIAAANQAASSVNTTGESSVDSAAVDAANKSEVKAEEADVKLETPGANKVIDTINECDKMITAVESVAAMYCVPSSYIVEDPFTDRMTVTKGHIIVPSNTTAKPSDNAKSIIQAVGAVLDYISQRADDKLDTFQANNIRDGINKDKINDVIDPSKGKVFASRIDGNGDPVVVYDDGSAQLSSTKEAQETYDSIPNKPEFKNQNEYQGYFNDDDDIMKGITEENVPEPTPEDYKNTGSTEGSGPETEVIANDSNEMNVADAIKEAGYLLDAIGQRGNTRHLGYDIMQEQGFNFVKPCDFFVESATKKKNKQAVGSIGIEHMKFDNTKLLKAIKLMNEARKEQTGGKGKINLETLINNPKYQEAIDCLNDQFNARLNIRFIKKKEIGNSEFTTIYQDIKTHLVISKSKGFQLGGLPIDIFVTNTALDEDAPDDVSLFGQHVVSVFCHEIFHNIMAVLKSKEAQFTATLIETMTLARDIPSASNRRKLITNFVNMTDEFGDMKLNIVTKRAMIKHLTYLSTIAHDEQAVREYEKAIKSKKVNGIDEEIKRMEKKIRKVKINTYGPTRYIIPAILTVATFSWVSSTAGTGLFPVACMAFGSAVGNLFGQGIVQAVEIDTIKKFKNGTIKNYEEHWCDMFAACYNLPVTFFMVGKPRTGVANDYALETLKRYDELERESRQLMMIKYPTISERNQAAVKYAKKTLDSKAKLDPAIKKYLEWIVSNYSKTLDMDIDEIYSKGTFDPKTAENLDDHIEKLIGSANINVTESDLSWLSDIGDAEYL